jgi:hypothetical protein
LSGSGGAAAEATQRNKTRERERENRGTYIAAAHLGDERGRDDDGGAEHDEVVLEAQEDGLRCTATLTESAVSSGKRSNQHSSYYPCQEPNAATGEAATATSKCRRGETYAMAEGWSGSTRPTAAGP